MSELYHFNQNHSPKTGQFTFGDGDGDGMREYRERLKKAKKLEQQDAKWAKKNYEKIYKKAYKPIAKDMSRFVKKELNPQFASQLREGKVSKSYINEYNKRLAAYMNMNVNSLPTSPSGRVVQFIAKRGDVGVHMALTDPDYDISRFRNGVYGSGRVAYRQNMVNRMEI